MISLNFDFLFNYIPTKKQQYKMFSLVVAMDIRGGIGYDNKIPWHNPADLKHFKELTTNNVIIMGNKTFKSIGKPLPKRINIVFKRCVPMDETDRKVQINHIGNLIENKGETKELTDVIYVSNLEECVTVCKQFKDKKWFVIGGAQIYKIFMTNNLIYEAYITEISGKHKCDTFFDYTFSDWGHHPYIRNQLENLSVTLHYKINYDEEKYLSLMSEILKSGAKINDRTGTGTIGLFGKQLIFNLESFPLCTSRKMGLKSIFEELMLYLRGQTDANILKNKGINVWVGNTTREFLNKRGLNHLPEGDMGHSYGFSMRHYGGQYETCKTDYTKCRCGKACVKCPLNGFDQLEYLIKTIKEDPNSRRLRISLWEPNKMHLAALPPCLEQYQFNVVDNKLSCMMTQRSSDYFLAGGWNIATGALLTYLIAKVCDLVPDKLIWNIGDVHIYQNLITQSQELIKRRPYPYPKLNIKVKRDITKYEFADLELTGYMHHPALTGKMSV